jgi:hypothetical protein
MANRRFLRRFAAFVGGLFIVLGIVEVAVRVLSDDPVDRDAVVFWFLSLCGGGALILAGHFAIRTGWVSKGLVATGCLLGSIATAWTLLLPILAIALLALTMLEDPSGAIPDGSRRGVGGRAQG